MRQAPVFVIDDDEDSLMILGELLELEGLRPSLFRAAEDALAALVLGEESPSLFIVDLTLLEALRREPRSCHLPMIVFTAWNDLGAASRLGIPAIRKPDVEGLLATIAAVRPREASASPRTPSARSAQSC